MSFLEDDAQEYLESVALEIVSYGKGILAADESPGTMGKRFHSIDGCQNTEANRQRYREMLLTTPGLQKSLGGIILHEETFYQHTRDGEFLLREEIRDEEIKVGIKVDGGLEPFSPTSGSAEGDKQSNSGGEQNNVKEGEQQEQKTRGLDDLNMRAARFKKDGADFAKWRCVYQINREKGWPSEALIKHNAETLAEYALICQINGLVPIVEPEVLRTGAHSLDECQEVTHRVLTEVIYQMHLRKVYFPGVIIKPNMITPGEDYVMDEMQERFLPEDVAHATVETLFDTVPMSITGIAFLSGGQTPDEALLNLTEINKVLQYAPWALTFSFGRGLQKSVLEMWNGKDCNIVMAQKELLANCEACGHATLPQVATTDPSFTEGAASAEGAGAETSITLRFGDAKNDPDINVDEIPDNQDPEDS